MRNTTWAMEQANKSGWTLNSNEAKWGERKERYLEFGGRASHASVVLDDNTVVVIGGEHEDGLTSSVLLMPPRPSPQKFVAGPNMNEKRDDLAAVVCNGYLYAIGGSSRNLRILDTLERTLVADLKRIAAFSGGITTSSTANHSNDRQDDDDHQSHGKWEKVNARLSVARSGCAAVAVYNRFIVVMGGNMFFSTVDVIDTMELAMRATWPTTSSSSENNNYQPSTVASVRVGPSMLIPRRCLGAVVLGNKIWAVGGLDTDERALDTLEYISFHMTTTTTTTSNDSSSDLPNETELRVTSKSPNNIERRPSDCIRKGDCSTLTFSSSSWNTTAKTTNSATVISQPSNEKNIKLSIARYRHATCLIGSCLVVAGGVSHNFMPLASVEVVDLDRRVVWKLPDLTVPRIEVSMVSISKNQLLVLGGWNGGHFLNSMESLTCVELSLRSIQQELVASENRLRQQQHQVTKTALDAEEEEERNKQKRLKRLFSTLVYYNLTNNVDKCV